MSLDFSLCFGCLMYVLTHLYRGDDNRAPNGAKYSHYLLDSGGGGGGGGAGGAGGGGGSSNSASSGAGGANSRSAYPATAAAAAQQEKYSSQYEHGSRRPDWRPRQGVLVASLREHGGAVNRLALSQDQAFFVSASSDSTCKVMEGRGGVACLGS